MKTLEDISDIFSIFHDGTISAWEGNSYKLTLTIECKYLAERIDKSFDKFYVELFQISKLELDPWMNPIELPAVVKTDLIDIFKADLEILNAEIKNDFVAVVCEQHDLSFDYCGGILSIRCESAKVFDQNNNELTIEELDKICNDYWNKWSNKE